jgi:sulfhydrogenase subunit gamma (sulfur reductase)
MTGTETRSLLIKRVREQARDTRSFDMIPEDGEGRSELRFVPGQVAILRAGDEGPAYFAFASAPEDEEVEFLIKRGGGASGLIYEMTEGSRVELVNIVGSGFALDEQKGKDLVFVAMGTGVAPLRSALRHTFRHAGDYGQLVVLYGARTPDDFCYRDETETWEEAGVELRQVISRPDGHDWSGPTGYVQSLLDHVLPDLSNPVALICGSREMIEQTRDRLRQMGFAPEAILTNY